MSVTGKAFETLRRCLKTGEVASGEEALELIFLRLVDLMGEVTRLKKQLGDARAAEWSRELEASVIAPADDVDDLIAAATAEEAAREPHAEQGRDDTDDDGRDEAALGRRDE